MKSQILVEGPDCSGKTTLVERLKNELHWDAKSLHHLEGDQFKRYLREYALAERIVFNRGHFSEIAYSMLWRDGNPFSAEEHHILDEICRQNMIVILASPPLEVLQQRYQQRDFPQQIRYEELAMIDHYFREIMKDVPHLHYRSSSQQELQSLITILSEKIS